MSNPTVQDRLDWTIEDNAKKAIEIVKLKRELERAEYIRHQQISHIRQLNDEMGRLKSD